MRVDPLPLLAAVGIEPTAVIDGVAPLSSLQRVRPPADATLLVGPEGGWTEAEVANAHARGVRLVTMGHRTLRADATPVAAISVLQFLFGDL